VIVPVPVPTVAEREDVELVPDQPVPDTVQLYEAGPPVAVVVNVAAVAPTQIAAEAPIETVGIVIALTVNV
jgi:hypothetical protein